MGKSLLGLLIEGVGTLVGVLNNLLPSQTGQATKVLGTDGTNASWVTNGGGGGTSQKWTIISASDLPPIASNGQTNNSGSNNLNLLCERDNANNMAYWQCNTDLTASQDTSIIIEFPIPDSFVSWKTSNALVLNYKTTDTTAGVGVQVEIRDTSNTQDYNSSVLQTSNTWAQLSLTNTELNGTYTIGGVMTIIVTLKAIAVGGILMSAYLGKTKLMWD